MRASPVLLSLILALIGCPTDGADGNLPFCELPDPEELAPGNFVASINGSPWEAPAVPVANPWQLSGTGFQTSGSADGKDMTIRLTMSSTYEEDDDGEVDIDPDDPIQDVFDDQPASVDFRLGNQNLDGGDTSLTIDTGLFHTNQNGGDGFLRLGFQEGEDGAPGTILACFFYTAGDTDSDDVAEVTDGAFVLSQ
jgi:hypothetical protein